MMFINDIVQHINDDFNEIFSFQELRLFILLYADDAVLFAKSPKVLQSLLHDLEIYCLAYGLKINTTKTKAMIFENSRRHTHYANDVEMLHTKFCRYILQVRKSTNLTGLYGELGRTPMLIGRKLCMIRYWIKILKADDDFVPKKIYSMLKDDADNNKNYHGLNWASQIKSILCGIGLNYFWIQQAEIEIPFNVLKTKILDIYKQTWYTEINNSNRLSAYARFKHDFMCEKYLDFISDKKYRVALSKFRLSSHDLEIERGRHVNTNRSDRLCRFCNGTYIENEYHFLLVCPLYRDLRIKYFKPYYCRWPTLNKFDGLMCNTSKNVILNVAKYIYFAFQLRKENL